MKKSSLKNKIWLYLLIFVVVALGLIWFLQISSLDIYYELSKKNEIENIALKVLKSYDIDNYSEVLDNLSFENDVCIEITNNGGIKYSTDSAVRGCLVNGSKEVNNYKISFMKSGKNSEIFKIINPRFNNKTLIYSINLGDDNYAFISTSLEPVGSTVSVLKKQLVLIIIIVLIISFIVAYTISYKISNPIEKITKISREIESGKYNVIFETDSNIKEINELQNTLNSMSKELSKTENLRRELLANVSHDLKTPLTLIKANACMIKDFNYKSKTKREKNLDTIIQEVDRLNLLVDDVLELSKMQTNSIKLNLEKINLNDFIKDILDKFNILCEKEGYKINYSGFDCYVMADKKKMQQAIYNLVNNAINYTGEDKTIYIEIISLEDFIRVEIKDTGSGIDEENLKYIWDRYYKSDKKYKRLTYGTGLGLSIVKNVFIMHGFKYGVYSEKDKGTCFYFEAKKI